MQDINLLSDAIQKEVAKVIIECYQKSEIYGVGQIASAD